MKKFALFLGLGLIASTLAGCSGGNQLAFDLSEDRSSYSVRAASKNIVGEVEIPAEHNGLPVKAIANEGFSNRQNISKITIPEGIEYIGDIAFFGCSGIKSISLPKSLTTIGEMAFIDSGIEEISVNEENLYYSSLDNIVYNRTKTEIIYVSKYQSSVDLPGTITKITKGLFESNKALTSVVLPDQIVEIEDEAFKDCLNLESISFGSGLTSIGASAFEGCVKLASVKLPSSTISLGDAAFRNCLHLEELEFGASFVDFGEQAFFGCVMLSGNEAKSNEFVCSYLGSETVPYQVLLNVKIDNEVASGNQTNSLKIEDTCYAISDRSFENVSGIKELELPSSLLEINSETLSLLNELESISIGDTNQAFASSGHLLYTKDKTEIVHVPHAIKEVTIVEGVLSIGEEFVNHDKLENISIPNSVEKIEDSAFDGCDKLIAFPENVTTEFVEKYLGNASEPNLVLVGFDYNDDFEGENTNFYRIKDGCKFVMNDLFSSSQLEHIDIPNSIKSISSGNFVRTSSLEMTEIKENGFVCDYLGNSLNEKLVLVHAEIDEEYLEEIAAFEVSASTNVFLSDAFDDISDVEINVNPLNVVYKSVDGVIYNTLTAEMVYVHEGYTGSLAVMEGIKSISIDLLERFSHVESLSLPSTFVEPEEDDFDELYSLKEIVVSVANQNLSSFGGVLYNKAKTEVIYVPNKISEVEVYKDIRQVNQSFRGISSLKRVVLPEGYSAIESEAFMGCSSLEEVVLPSTLITIGDSAFEGCVKLSTFELPFGLMSIGAKAFASDTLIKSVVIPITVKHIGGGAFAGCKGMEEITIPFIGGEYNDYKFVSYIFGAPKVSNGESSIPESLKKVTLLMGDYYVVNHNAFYCHEPIEVVVLPLNIVAIGDHAFYGCENLKEINLSEGLTAIGDWAFFNCKELEEITLPSTLKYIGRFAFRDCIELAKVNFAGTKAEWQAIEKGGWWNAAIKASVVVCSDGEIGI